MNDIVAFELSGELVCRVVRSVRDEARLHRFRVLRQYGEDEKGNERELRSISPSVASCRARLTFVVVLTSMVQPQWLR